MRSIIAICLSTTAIAGCFVYDENLVYDTGTTDASDGPERPADNPDTPDEPDPADALSLFPAGAALGDVTILSLCAEGVNLNDIVDATFLGESDIGVLTTGRRGEGEFLMTVDIPPNSAQGVNHLLLELANGTTLFLEDAFTVVANSADIPIDAGVNGSCD